MASARPIIPPLLTSRRVIGPFLAAWLPLAAVVALVLAQSVTWSQAIAVAVPAAAVISFLCSAAAYPARGMALGGVPGYRMIMGHMVGAAVATSIWLGMLRLWVEVLARFSSLDSLRDAFARHLPLLAAFGVLVYLLAVVFHSFVAAVDQSRRAERRALESELAARESELKLLRAQVDPHFLFNSLNAIAGLTHGDPDLARSLCLRLGEFLRAGLRIGSRPRIRFEEELTLARDYMEIERIRFGERLRYEEQVGADCSRVLVPPLILQPLLENAVRHGIAGLVGAGDVRLEAASAGGRMTVVIENSRDPDAQVRRGEGVGLANVRRRLRAMYGGSAQLAVEPARDRYRATLTIPEAAPEDPS